MTLAEICLNEYLKDYENNPYTSLSWHAQTNYKGKLYTYKSITKWKFKDNSKLIYNKHTSSWAWALK